MIRPVGMNAPSSSGSNFNLFKRTLSALAERIFTSNESIKRDLWEFSKMYNLQKKQLSVLNNASMDYIKSASKVRFLCSKQ